MRLFFARRPRLKKSKGCLVHGVLAGKCAVVASAIYGRGRQTLRRAADDGAEAPGTNHSPDKEGSGAQPFDGDSGKGQEPRILILDDEVSVRRVCTFALRGMGWRPEGEGSARAALNRILDGEHFDVVVLDYAMPDMNGLEFLQALAAAPDLARRPRILMASAHADGAVAKQAMRLGVWDFLAKPLMPDDIRRRTRRLLNRAALADRGGRIAAALQRAGQCDWPDALEALADVAMPPAPLLRGLFCEMSGDEPAARREYARAYWSANWSEEGPEVWAELSRRLDVSE